RLGKGTGPLGLGGMAPVSHRGAMRVLRPLLETSRAAIMATVEAHDLKVTEDPSNTDLTFQRNRLRAAADDLAGLGLTNQGISRTAQQQGQANRLLERQLANLAAMAVSIDGLGCGYVHYPVFHAAGDGLLRETLIGRLISTIGGHHYPIKRQLREHAAQWIAQPFEALKPITLGRCLLSPSVRDGRQDVTVVRETVTVDALELKLTDENDFLRWDNRFSLSVGPFEAGEDAKILPADQAVWSMLKEDLPDRLAGLPARLRCSLPSLYRRGDPIAVLAPGYLDAQPAATGWAVSFSPPLPMLRSY
ncbi:MAG: ATP-binding protein, partial [Pseudomonadota bacterium]